MKLKQKIGAFRTFMGSKWVARTRGNISTVREKMVNHRIMKSGTRFRKIIISLISKLIEIKRGG